jgi:hypothetical protein
MEMILGYWDRAVSEWRTRRLRLATTYGQGPQYSPYLSIDVPPDPTYIGFEPKDGVVEYDAATGTYARRMFGESFMPVPTGASRALFEYAFDGTAWSFSPQSSGASDPITNTSRQSAVHDHATDTTWLLGAGWQNVYARQFDASSPSGRWVNLGNPCDAVSDPNCGIDDLHSPVVTSYAGSNGTVIDMHVVARREIGPQTQFGPANGTWELWRRTYDGTAWGTWTNLGGLPGAQPGTDFWDDYFWVGSAVTWDHSGQRNIDLFAVPFYSNEIHTLECRGPTCTALTPQGSPMLGGQPVEMFSHSAFVHHDAGMTYESNIGRTRNRSIIEMYRDSRQPGSAWSFRTLYAAPGTQWDWDGDGVSSSQEESYASADPNEYGCLDPYHPDSDGDGLSDGEEIDTYLTAACSPDTDLDRMPDRYEAVDHTCLDPLTDDRNVDADGDGLTNGAEFARGLNPCSPDSDGDGVDDFADNCGRVWNAIQFDLDGDGVGDACDSDRDGDGCANIVDSAPDNPNVGASTCRMTNSVVDEEFFALDDRLGDPRLHDLIDGLIPRIPDGFCPFCEPFFLERYNEETGESFPAVELEGFDPEWLEVYTAMMVPDLDGDRLADIVVGLPLATTSEDVESGGVALVLSSETGRTLARVEGSYPGQGLGSSLALYDDGLLALQPLDDPEAMQGESFLRLDEVSVFEPLGPND